MRLSAYPQLYTNKAKYAKPGQRQGQRTFASPFECRIYNIPTYALRVKCTNNWPMKKLSAARGVDPKVHKEVHAAMHNRHSDCATKSSCIGIHLTKRRANFNGAFNFYLGHLV